MSRISAGEAFVSVSVDNKNLLSGLKEASARIQETTRTFNASKSALNPNLSISNADAFRASLREVRREAEQTANVARKLSDRFVITAGDIYHAFRGVASTLTNLLGGMGDEFDKMAARTGLSTEALSEYAHAAKMAGSDVGAVESAMRSLATQLVAAQNGSARARKSFEILGLNIDEIAALNPERQFDAIARAIGSIADPTERAGAAMKIFGSAGSSLLPLFSEGPDGLAKLRAEARRLGVSIDKETAKIGADFTDAQTRVRAALQGIGISLSRIITPEIVKASNAGNYTLPIDNLSANARGIRRVRYLNAMLTESPLRCADAMIRNGDKKSYEIHLSCPSCMLGKEGYRAVVRDTLLGEKEDMYISAVHYRMTSDGEYSNVILKRRQKHVDQ